MNSPEPVNPFATPTPEETPPEGAFTALWILVAIGIFASVFACMLSVPFAIVMIAFIGPGFLRAYLVLRRERGKRMVAPGWDRQMQVAIGSIGWMLPVYFFAFVGWFLSFYFLQFAFIALRFQSLAMLGIVPLVVAVIVLLIGFHSSVKASAMKDSAVKGKAHEQSS